MSNVTDTEVELKLPYWNDLLNDIPTDVPAAHRALNNAIEFQTGLENLSPAQFTQPEMVNNIQARMCELGAMVDVPVPDLTEVIPVERKDVVSTESAKEIFKSVIKKIIDWLFALIDWFKKLAKSFSVSEKLQKTAAANVAKFTRKKTSELDDTAKDAPIIANVPARALVLFHTTRHNPAPGYRYDAPALKSSMVDVANAVKILTTAMLDEIAGASIAVDALADAVIKDKPIDRNALGRINQHRQLYGLQHNNFQVMGLALQTKPTSPNNPIRTEKCVIRNEARNRGWLEAGAFTFEASPRQLVELTDDMEKQIDTLNGLVGKMHNQMIFKGINRRISDLKHYIDNTKESSELSPAQQQSTMVRLQAMQDIASQLQLNISSIELFTRNYINLMVGMTSAAMGVIQSA